MLSYSLASALSRSAATSRAFAGACLLAVPILLSSAPATAATQSIDPSRSSVDCSTSGIRPGDAVVLAGRSRGPIKFSNCYGTASNPIVIRNDTSQSGPLVISQSGDGFKTQCVNCEHVVFDGTGKWAGAPAGSCGATLQNGKWALGSTQCGMVFRCSSGSPHSGFRLAGSSKHVTVKGIEIDGNYPTCKSGIGLSVNDHNYAGKSGEWREGILLSNNYIHRTEGEGIYMGPNQNKTSSGDLQLRDNEIAFNLVDRSGCDGINYKSAIAGSSRIHHNYVTNTGQSPRGGDSGCSASGIALFEAGYTDVYSNYVEAPSPVSSGAGHCISQIISNLSSSKVAKVPIKIYNNVTRNCKGNGLSFARRDTSVAEPVVSIYNNTVVAPIGGKGVNVSSSIGSCNVRDNIVAGKAVVANQCSIQNNTTDDVESQKFRDPASRDFRLTAISPAVDVGTNNCPTLDLIGTSRPQQGICDQGAFEFIVGDTIDSRPRPPELVQVE